MGRETLSEERLLFKPVTIDEWNDLEKLFAQMGPLSGCWCMYWRIRRSDFRKQFGKGNREALRRIIESGEVPGILAYVDGEPIGWCSIAPREAFPVLDRSRTLKRIDNKPVWSIVCFFVSKPFRQKGLSTILTNAAIEYAKKKGAEIIEAYPLIPQNSKNPSVEAYTGVVTMFERIGFEQVACRSRIRPIMRYYIESQK